MERISCKGPLGEIPPCKFDAPWFCKHPDCNGPVLTATLHGAWPENCPLKREDELSKSLREMAKELESDERPV